MAEFLMPKLGADMAAGTLVSWKKQPGETVRRGDIMAEVDTDKGVIEIEVFVDGVVRRLLVRPGDTVPVGQPLAVIDESGGEEAASSECVPPSVPRATLPAPPPSAPGRTDRLPMSPAARRRAAELEIDVSLLVPARPGAAVTMADVERAAQSKPSAPPGGPLPGELTASDRMRKAIAAAMSRANRDIPHYYLSTTIDLERLLTWLEETNRQRPVQRRVIHSAALLKGVALELRNFPDLNGFWESDQHRPVESVHLGVAIALRQGGLVAPAIHDADRLSIEELMLRLSDLVDRTRSGSLRGSELSDATVTVSILGDQGVEGVYGVIYPPQVALVGFGRIVERPWVVDDRLVVRRVITATLAGDHRASDGHRGGRFLAALDRRLQEPEKL